MVPTGWRRRSTIAFSDRSVRFSTDSRLDSVRGDHRLTQRRGAVRDVRSSLQDAGPAGGSPDPPPVAQANFWGQCAENGECTSPLSGASPVSGEGTVPAHFENGVSARPVPTQDAAMSTFESDQTPKREMVLRNQTGPSQSSIVCSTSTAPTSFRMSECT
jgi:hypothetical protein